MHQLRDHRFLVDVARQPFSQCVKSVRGAVGALVNLRGVRESGLAFAIPTYLFIVALLGVIAWGLWKTVAADGHPTPVDPPPAVPPAAAVVSWWLLAKAFASGCTAMTGVEAVSNGVAAFREPAVRYARRTLTAIIVLLAVMLLGIAALCRAYGVAATEPDKPFGWSAR